MPDIFATIEPPPALDLTLEVKQGPAGPPGIGGSGAQYTASEPIGGHTVVTLNAVGQAVIASTQELHHAIGVIGITLGAAEIGAPVHVVWNGTLDHNGWAFLPDGPVYLGSGGQVTQAPPSGLFIKPVGIALSPTRILVSIQPAIFTTT